MRTGIGKPLSQLTSADDVEIFESSLESEFYTEGLPSLLLLEAPDAIITDLSAETNLHFPLI